jgi:transcriptional regulator with XRE-family HTH domain
MKKNPGEKPQLDFFSAQTAALVLNVRMKHDLSQGRLGKYLGVQNQTISKIERGIISPKNDFFWNLLMVMQNTEAGKIPKRGFPWTLRKDL